MASALKYILFPILALLLLLCTVIFWVPACHAQMCVWQIASSSIPDQGEVQVFYYNTYDDSIGTYSMRNIMEYADTRITTQLNTAPFHFAHRTNEKPLDERESTVWQLPKGYVCLTFGDWNDNDSLSLAAGEGDFLKQNEGRVYTPGKPVSE